MNVLFISNLFPNVREPTRGMFNAHQVSALSKYCSITKVIAPSQHRIPNESLGGITITHPRFRTIPFITRPLNGWLFSRAIEKDVRNSQFDCVLVNWAYPDAYGVMLLARKYGFRFATTVQGSDVNVFFRNPVRKRQVLAALRASAAIFCRSMALRETLAAEGIAATTVYNGIDREKFRPMDRHQVCRQLGLDSQRRRVLYVGNLQPIKGPTVLAEAYKRLQTENPRLKTIDLVFIGIGPERDKVARISSQQSVVSFEQSPSPSAPSVVNNSSSVCRLDNSCGIWQGRRLANSAPSDSTSACSPQSSVHLMAARPHHEVPLWMNACDVLCIPSYNEGLPNVALEALACGLPVVASRVGGIPEVIEDGRNGLLFPAGDSSALASAIEASLTRQWDKEHLRQSVSRFDWDTNARLVCETLQKAMAA